MGDSAAVYMRQSPKNMGYYFDQASQVSNINCFVGRKPSYFLQAIRGSAFTNIWVEIKDCR